MNVEMANNNNKENKVANAPLLRFPEFKDEWEETFLNDCSDYISERINTNKLSEEQYISTENMLQNFYGVENSNNVPNNSNVISFLEQDILISNIRPYLKKIWLANRNGGASTDVLVLRAKKNIEPSFLFYNLANDNFINHVMAGCKGVKMPRGDKHQILTYKLGIPSSSEQSKISDFLSLLDKRIELQKSAIEKLKSLKYAIREKLFSTEESKESVVLSDVVERVTRKNKYNETNVPLTISAQYGLVSQNIFFNKTIASENLANYYLLKRGEFAYNKSYSSDYAWGAIKRLNKYNQGVLSPLYICFRPKSNVDSDYLSHYFETSKWHKAVSDIAGEGARNHGLLNISVIDFFNTKHCITTDTSKQKRISKYLDTFDKRIEIETKLLDLYKAQKNFLLSKMFI